MKAAANHRRYAMLSNRATAWVEGETSPKWTDLVLVLPDQMMKLRNDEVKQLYALISSYYATQPHLPTEP